jgi:hypothetical protein
MLQTPSTFNQQMPFTSQMGGTPGIQGYPNAGQSNMGMPQSQSMAPQDPMSQIMGDPQTMSYAHGGKTRKKRTSMVEAYMAPDEIAKMVDAQGGPEYDRHTGRHVFKKLSRFSENPHVERAIRAKFAQGGHMGGYSFAGGGSTRYSMPQRSPLSAEQYARGGDTELVYITPHMKRLFDDIGAGSINPVNGKPEYFGMSDIWNGIKGFGAGAIGGAAKYAPQIAKALQPEVAELGGPWGELAQGALAFAPYGLNALNGVVNPAPPKHDVSGLQEMPFAGEDMSQPRMNAGERGARFAGNLAGQFDNPASRAVSAGAQSYQRGVDPRQTASNMVQSAVGPYNNPAATIARQGAQQYGARTPMKDILGHMGTQTTNQMLGQPLAPNPNQMNRNPNSNNLRQTQSQMLDQVYQQQLQPYQQQVA